MTEEIGMVLQTANKVHGVCNGAAPKNPRRVAAGRLNRMKRKGVTEEGRRKMREAALKYRPWQYSTGPRTRKGKAKVAENGRYRQRARMTTRAIRAEIRQARAATRRLAELTRLILADSDSHGVTDGRTSTRAGG